VFSAIALAGVAGASMCTTGEASSTRAEFIPLKSIEMVVWVATSGDGTLVLARSSAPSRSTTAQDLFTHLSPETWLLHPRRPVRAWSRLAAAKGLVGLLDGLRRQRGDN